MITVQVSDKGQVTLPAGARKVFGLKRNSKLEVEFTDKEIILRPVRSVREVKGMFREAARQKPADWETVRTEMERMVAEEVANEGK